MVDENHVEEEEGEEQNGEEVPSKFVPEPKRVEKVYALWEYLSAPYGRYLKNLVDYHQFLLVNDFL